jgi:hypothetical protein
MTGTQSIPFVCEECQARFDALNGGICRACHRLLCSRHFAFPERWPLWRRGAARSLLPLCRACAAAALDRARATSD